MNGLAICDSILTDYKNVPKDIPLQYELGTILKLMQEMYELGFADGYAEGFAALEVLKNEFEII